jgi:hypothetical protein
VFNATNFTFSDPNAVNCNILIQKALDLCPKTNTYIFLLVVLLCILSLAKIIFDGTGNYEWGDRFFYFMLPFFALLLVLLSKGF